jgi:hypothetical protein
MKNKNYTKRKNNKKLSRKRISRKRLSKKRLSNKRLSNKKRSKKKLKGGMEGRGMTETEMAAQAVNRKTGSRHDTSKIMEVLEANEWDVEEAALRLNVNKLVEIGFEEEKARKTLEGMNESFRSIWVAGKISKSPSQGTMEPQSQGTMGPPSQGTMEPQSQGTMGPPSQGTMEPPPDTLQTQRGKFNAICGNKRLDPRWMRGVYGDSWTEEDWKKELFYKLNESAKIFGKEVVESALQIELNEFPASLEMKIAEAISLGKINPGKEYNIGIKVLNEFCEMINKWLDINQYKEYLRQDLVDLPKQEQEQEVQKRRDHQKWARENRAEAIAAAEAPAPAAVALEPAPAPGSDDNIGRLVEMGFNQVDAQEALEINQNDWVSTLNFLLSGAPVHRRAGAASSRSPVGD